MENFLNWVARSPTSVIIQEHAWMVPTIQALHIMCVAAVFTSAVVLDMRLFGVMEAGQPLGAVTRRFAPWIGGGVVVLLATGLLLMVAEPTRALLNKYFQLKMAAVLLAGTLTWWSAASISREPDAWAGPAGRRRARLVATASLVLWTLIVIAGRWIAYAS